MADSEAGVIGEARWPMALAVLATICFTLMLPGDVRVLPVWVVPTVEALLLVALIAGDPGAISRRSTQLRVLSIALVALLVIASLVATTLLVIALVDGGHVLDSASALLRTGAVVWLCNVIAFGLLFWELDGGGAAQRVHAMPEHSSFAFIQQANPHLAQPGWRPRFVDYLYLAVTNAIAFSPTDTMPLKPWAKIAMAVESVVALLILGLVIARAVNVLQ